MSQDQHDDWLASVEGWLDEQRIDLEQRRDQARELLAKSFANGELKKMKADLLTDRVDLESGLEQMQHPDAGFIPARLLIKGAALLQETDEILAELNAALK